MRILTVLALCVCLVVAFRLVFSSLVYRDIHSGSINAFTQFMQSWKDRVADAQRKLTPSALKAKQAEHEPEDEFEKRTRG